MDSGWGGASILGIVNGAIREFAYKDRLGQRQASRLSALTLVSLLALYFGLLQRCWPLATTRDALSIGAIWGAMTVIFEFGFGHYVNGNSWEERATIAPAQRRASLTVDYLPSACSPARSRASIVRARP
jgi:hypothetical protein